jgi:flagellar hook-length control protein FliK
MKAGAGTRDVATPSGEPSPEEAAVANAADPAPTEATESVSVAATSYPVAPDTVASDRAAFAPVSSAPVDPVASSPDDPDPVAAAPAQNSADAEGSARETPASSETPTSSETPASAAAFPVAATQPEAGEAATVPGPEGRPEDAPATAVPATGLPGSAVPASAVPAGAVPVARGLVRAAPAEVGPPQGLPAHANAGANGRTPFAASSSPDETTADGADDVPASKDAPETQARPVPAGALDNPGLRRALGQLGFMTSGQAGAAVAVQSEAAASGQAGTAASGPPAAVAPGQATPAAPARSGIAAPGTVATGVVGELAQASPTTAQQGLSQALSSLAEAGGKAAPTAPPATVPSAPVVPNVPLGAVPIEIGLKALAGVNHFQIRLDPAELGRIDVNLEIDTDGTIKARLTVDRVETLTLLQRDARTLERAFEQAGLKPSDGGVDLSLRDQGRDDRRGPPENGGRDNAPAHARAGGESEPKRPDAAVVHRTIWRGASGIDVRI